MEAFFFGEPEQALFGAYHPPQSAPRAQGVILCHPLGQEYIRSHRAFLLLGQQLSQAGFHVLRFDLSGCGDSGGDFEQGSLRRWQADIEKAMEEIQQVCGITHIVLIGLRLGGSLAACVGEMHGGVDAMVLWDPVVEGRTYLAELASMHARWLQGSFARPRPVLKAQVHSEALGFPLTHALVRSLEGFNLLDLSRKPAERILWIETTDEARSAKLEAHLNRLGARTDFQHLPSPPAWVKFEDEFDQAMIPTQVLNLIRSWLLRELA